MENARFLKDMIICSPTEEFDMIKELAFCSRLSPTCNLSFKKF